MRWDLMLAYLADLLVGDPRTPWHPVRIMGRAAAFYEEKLRAMIVNERVAGLVLAVSLPLDSFVVVFLLVFLAGQVHLVLGFLVSAFFIYSSLSVKDMADQASEVYTALKEDALEDARRKVANIVGRDTEHLSGNEIVRAAVESIAESTVDGIVSPLFYATLGGAPLAVAFKAVSTLDSMVGYKDERYLEFGAYSAKADDLANFIPARLSYLLIPLAALLCGASSPRAFQIAVRDGGKNPSPNSGIPEAAFAGALGVRLGGASFYQGIRFEKPAIGDEVKKLDIEDIPRAIRLMYWTSFLAVVLFLTVSLLLQLRLR